MPPDEKKAPSSIVEDVEYTFAMEYDGPALPYELPRAVPIDVETIPVASVVSSVCLAEDFSLPVVQPIPGADPPSKKFSKELKPSSVSPTSVIANHNGHHLESKDLELASESTVSPTSVIGFEERTEDSCNVGLSGEFSCSNCASDELSDDIDLSREPGCCSDTHGHCNNLTFSESFDKSKASSSRFRVPDVRKGSLDMNDSNHLADWESNESILSIDYPSSRVSSLKPGDCNDETMGDVKRQPIVTFRDIESNENFDDGEYSQGEAWVMPVKRETQTKGKKGACYRCHKGSRFTEKEVCLVCDAKYCSSCVLRAMGSMPEGRKCVTCIGFPINESKRGTLGKSSRMLKRLLNELEVRQILKAEKFCEANQLPAEFVRVNGKPLCHEELVVLQTCPNPPKKLQPGNYWYDKVSGLWGKEGEKPSKIISPHLNVGGPIRPDASNGNTGVFINCREITKVELRMLQLAGVQCAGSPHFWVNEDGSYQEEGQKNTKGYIWGKAGTKLLCAFLSLPVPSKSSSNLDGDQLYSMNGRGVPNYLEQRTLQKILLVGYNGCGTSTIFKQSKILYKDVPFSEDERENIKLKIQTNVYSYLGILLEGRERFEEESICNSSKRESSEEKGSMNRGNESRHGKSLYSIGPRFKAFSDWLLKTMVSGNLEAVFPAATREYAPLVEELWRDAAIQATYKRRNELGTLPSVASYFLERAVDALRTDYEPSDMDILYAEGVTSSTGLACVEFSFPQAVEDEDIDSACQHDSLLRYQLIRVHSRGLGENCKWIEMFEDVSMVIFTVALSDYDQCSDDGTNKMLLARNFFESIVMHPTFDDMDFLLILNKFDLFEEKIERVPLTCCEWFDDFHPVISRHRSTSSSSSSVNNNPSLGQLGFHYIAVKFKRLYASLTGKKLYVSCVKALEPKSVDRALKYAKEVLKWSEESKIISMSDYSMFSTEASSFSH